MEFRPFKDEDDFDLPLYSTPGKMVIHVYYENPPKSVYDETWKWDDLEITYAELDTAIFWIQEGMGLDYFVESYLKYYMMSFLIDGCQWFTVERITGEYHRGDWGFDDDSEKFEWKTLRPATLAEMYME
jgi:hypothetical protein